MENKFAYYSERYVRKWGLSMSMNKFEKQLGEESSRREEVILTSYFYHNKKDKVNKYKHPRLFKKLEEYEKALKDKDMSNGFYKQYNVMEYDMNKSSKNNSVHKKYREMLQLQMNEKGLTMHFVSKRYNVEYSNLYNYLKNKMNKLSLMKVNNLLKEMMKEYEE